VAAEWANSADKHGIDHEDALYAIENAVYVEQEFDEPRVPGHAKPWLFIDPHGNWAGRCSTSWRRSFHREAWWSST
jgi:hypothetical protein